MRLRNTAAAVKFRADLPAWMEPKGSAFIEIDARPAGRINNAFMAAREGAIIAHQMRGEGETAEDKARNSRDFGRDWMAAIYDTCVIEWRTNLIDDEKGPLTCDRETFLELSEVRIAEVSDALRRFVEEILAAGQKVLDETEATVKN